MSLDLIDQTRAIEEPVSANAAAQRVEHNSHIRSAGRPETVPVRLRIGASCEREQSGYRPVSIAQTLSGSLSAIARRCFRQCPACSSQEVYAIRRGGHHAEHIADRSLLVQRLMCERCLHRFIRPGRLFGAPLPLVRPRDLYD